MNRRMQATVVLAAIAVLGQGRVQGADETPLRVAPRKENSSVDLWNTEVGSQAWLKFELPDDVADYKEAILFLHVNDIDAPEEAELIVNDQVTVSWPESLVGEAMHAAAIPLDINALRPGSNDFKFVFKSNLNNTTQGYSVLSAELQLFKELSPEHKARIMLDAASWGKPGDWAANQAKPGKDPEVLGWKPTTILQGDGQGSWIARSGQIQFLHRRFPGDQRTKASLATAGPVGNYVMPFGLAQMDNGEVVFLGSWNPGDGRERIVIAFSSDRGDTWSELEPIPDAYGRPIGLAYLGQGDLRFGSGYFSSDYGRTWPERIPRQLPSGGGMFGVEGNPLVDRDAQGLALRMAEIGYYDDLSSDQKLLPSVPVIRWSRDGGRTWTDEVQPREWRWQETYAGHTYTLGTSEGSLVRAKNGWVVAALRTDRSARYWVDRPHDDSMSGTAVSISKDDGATWSPLNFVCDAGRHHPHLLLLPNGDIVMTVVVRIDVQDGKLASYRRGCEAVISRDNGLTWDLAHRYVLDSYEFYDGAKWFNGQCGHLYSILLDDGSILTCYANYLAKGGVLIKWKPWIDKGGRDPE